MQMTLDKVPMIVREWLNKSRTAPTLAEAAYYQRKARLALEQLA